MIEREPLTAPDGTLFLVGPNDVLLTTLDGKEATVSRRDLAVLFQRLSSAGEQPPAEEAPSPRLRFKLLRAPDDESYA